MLHHLAVVGLLEEGVHAARHDGAHVGHLQQLLFGGGRFCVHTHQRIERAKVFGQVFGGGLAHMPDAQRKQKARQRGLLGLFQRGQQVQGRAVAHALQHHQGAQAQAVQVGQRADHVGVHQLVYQLVAQALNVHGAAGGKVQDGFLALRRAEQAARAAVVGLALFTHHLAAANGALARHAEVLDVGRARAGSHHAHHFGNHIACAPHDHLVAHAHAFFANLKQVVQRGIGHRDATHKHRRQARHGRELAGAAHLDVDAFDLGRHLLRGVLVRHGPARLAGLEAQVALQLQRVDLVDHAINVVGQRIATGAHLLVKRY